jgi:hypothetical protein
MLHGHEVPKSVRMTRDAPLAAMKRSGKPVPVPSSSTVAPEIVTWSASMASFIHLNRYNAESQS